MSNVTTTKKGVQELLSSPSVQEKLKQILGKNAATFATSVVQITQSNGMLATAEPNSIVGAAMTAATLNLPLNNNLGYAYIIPYNTKNKDGSWSVKAQFQIGYKGFIQLAMRSGQFKTIHCTSVKKGEIASRDRLTGAIEFSWIEDDKVREKTESAGYVAYFKLINGFEATFFMSIDELNSHGSKFSKTFGKNNSLWKTDFDSMASKTVLKLLISKYAPLSVEMQTAVQTDQASFNDVEDTEDISYVDNEDVKVDPQAERDREFVSMIETLDDVEIARANIPESNKVLHAEIDLKEQMIKNKK